MPEANFAKDVGLLFVVVDSWWESEYICLRWSFFVGRLLPLKSFFLPHAKRQLFGLAPKSLFVLGFFGVYDFSCSGIISLLNCSI
jgi:hypothetical protein